MTLALIRGSNYLENGGHGPRSFTLIEFQYLPLAAWAPGCDLKQLIKAEHLPRLLSLPRMHQFTSQPAGKVRGTGSGRQEARQLHGAACHPSADPTRHPPVPRPLPKCHRRTRPTVRDPAAAEAFLGPKGCRSSEHISTLSATHKTRKMCIKAS